jgi:hypothetical protein
MPPKKKARSIENGTQAMKQWWIDKIITSDFPYRKNDFNAAQSFCSHPSKGKVNYGFSAQIFTQACFW